MSGNNKNATSATTSVLTDKRTEFGLYEFSNPLMQKEYKYHEDLYKRKMLLKRAYDNQEFLVKMRADIKREYLARKKQIKKLQVDAAVEFRNAEYLLQEHYVESIYDVNDEDYPELKYRTIDIESPLVSQISIPYGRKIDLETFDIEQEFESLLNYHEELCKQAKVIEKPREPEISWEQWVQENYGPREEISRSAQREEEAEFLRYHKTELAKIADEFDLQSVDSCYVCEDYHNFDVDAECCDEYPDEYSEYTIKQIQEEEESKKRDEIFENKNTIIGANNKSKSKRNAAAAARARCIKQQKKQENHFIPIKITANTNHETIDRSKAEMLYRGKAQINLPKKNQQQLYNTSEAIAREARKREEMKWRQINAAQKQSSARGTRIANIPEPKPWHILYYEDSDDYDY